MVHSYFLKSCLFKLSLVVPPSHGPESAPKSHPRSILEVIRWSIKTTGRSWGDHSSGTVCSGQTWGLEFNSHHPCDKLVPQSQCWGGGERRGLEFTGQPVQSNRWAPDPARDPVFKIGEKCLRKSAKAFLLLQHRHTHEHCASSSHTTNTGRIFWVLFAYKAEPDLLVY